MVKIYFRIKIFLQQIASPLARPLLFPRKASSFLAKVFEWLGKVVLQSTRKGWLLISRFHIVQLGHRGKEDSGEENK